MTAEPLILGAWGDSTTTRNMSGRSTASARAIGWPAGTSSNLTVTVTAGWPAVSRRLLATDGAGGWSSTCSPVGRASIEASALGTAATCGEVNTSANDGVGSAS